MKVPTDKVVVYLHVPKTGGTNFVDMLKNNYPGHRFANNKGEQGDVLNRAGKLVCAWGHGSQHHCFKHDTVLFAFLRDPVERVISHWVEHKRNGPCKVSLEDIFLRSGEKFFNPTVPVRKTAGAPNALWYTNFYCRMFTGSSWVGPQPIGGSEEIKDEIIQNINNDTLTFGVQQKVTVPTIFGITERFQESIKLMAKIAGWKNIRYRERNHFRAFNKGKRRYNASPQLLKAIRERNQLDQEIYQAAREAFDRQLESYGV